MLCAADIYCQPNTGPEPFGIAFVEALYAGLPVVTTNLGAAPEIVTDDCGILVPPVSDNLIAALSDLIQDTIRRLRLSAAGPKRAAALGDPRTTMQAMENELKKLISDEHTL